MEKHKIIRVSTVPISMNKILKGQLKFLNQHYHIVGVSKYVKKDFTEIQDREGIIMIAAPFVRAINIVKDALCLFKLIVIFRKEKPVIVHSITSKAGLLSMVAAYITGVPVRMHTFTGLMFPTRTGFIQKILIYMDKLLCFAATNIYPEGNGVRNDLINFKITSKPLKILGNGNVNGVDIDHFSHEKISLSEQDFLRKDLGIKNSDFVFVFIGRLVRDKGINELVAAFLQLSQVNVKLVLVGPYEESIDPLNVETLQQIESNQNIISVGSQNDVRPYFAISDCLVFPSYREGFPNVVLEAGSMGLPSIVTDINGSNEIIINKHNGIIIPVKDTSAILSAMNKMIVDIDFYNYLKENARERIINNYQRTVVWEAILLEYNKLVGQIK